VASQEYRDDVNKRYDEIWKQAKESMFAFGFEESKLPTMNVSSDERERIFEDAWQRGNGFRFMFGTFCDISYDEDANREAANFIRRKIKSTVKDAEKARKLTPMDFYARRPLCDTGYYQQFNREHVDIIDLKANGIVEFTSEGIKTADDMVHELDVVIFATGFDAVDGNYTRLDITGLDDRTLKDHWADGPTSYLGVAVPDFPNLFTILGPNGPFTNLPPTIETQVEFISDMIQEAETRSKLQVQAKGRVNGRVNGYINGHADHLLNSTNKAAPVIVATAKAEDQWTQICDDLSKGSLFRKTDSWIFGANVPGKKNTTMFYFAGLGKYRQTLEGLKQDGYLGFRFE
jgi:cyclohexanone monooxygenase